MSEDLPPSIRDYFAGKNARDFATAVSGFSDSARVRDEGRDHQGPAAIRSWLEATARQYDDRAQVRHAVSRPGNVEVAAEVSGNFPGSPIVLRFLFTLEGDRIRRLEIAP